MKIGFLCSTLTFKKSGGDLLGNYRQVMLYGIRTTLGEDIIEGTDVFCKTKQGQEICGILDSADSFTFIIRNSDGKLIQISYDDIQNLDKL